MIINNNKWDSIGINYYVKLTYDIGYVSKLTYVFHITTYLIDARFDESLKSNVYIV